METFLDDQDMEIFEQRNQKIKQLQQQSLQFKEQLLKHISNKDYDCNLQIPIPHPIENIQHPQQQFTQIKNTNKFIDLPSNRSNNNQNSSREKNTQAKGLYALKNSYLMKTPKKDSMYQSPKSFVVSGASKKKQSEISISNCSKSSRNEQPSKVQKGNLTPTTANSTYKKWLGIEKQKYNYAQPQMKNQTATKTNKSDNNIKMKTDTSLLGKSTTGTKAKPQKEKSPINQFDSWYDSQKVWLKQTEEKIFKQRLQLESEIEKQEQFSYSPNIQEGSKYIVQQKYHNATLLERQQYYKEEQQYKSLQKKLREEEEKKATKIRISPMSRKILRSASPKSNCSFTICNSSNQNYSTLVSK